VSTPSAPSVAAPATSASSPTSAPFSKGWVRVKWDAGIKNSYRLGAENAIDLYPCPPAVQATTASPCIARYRDAGGYPVDIRRAAAFPGERVGATITAGEVFIFTSKSSVKHTHSDGKVYDIYLYQLADGRGWVHDFHADTPGVRQVQIIEVGLRVSWTKNDADVPVGSVGEITELVGTAKAKVKFPNGTWTFSIRELKPAQASPAASASKPAFASVKPVIRIHGASGSNANIVNGLYHLAAQSYRDKPMFQQDGFPDRWLVITSSGSWVVCQTKDKDAMNNSGWCEGLGNSNDPSLAKTWKLWNGSSFVVQESMRASALTISELLTLRMSEDDPKNLATAISIAEKAGGLTDAVTKAKAELARKDAALTKLETDAMELATRGVSITGATGKNSENINGRYVFTGERFNGKALFQREGDREKFLLLDKNKSWMVSPTSDKEGNTGAGWCFSVETDLLHPTAVRNWKVWDGDS